MKKCSNTNIIKNINYCNKKLVIKENETLKM